MNYKIEINMFPYEWEDKSKPYCWVIKSDGHDYGCGWSETPERAWQDALDYYNKHLNTKDWFTEIANSLRDYPEGNIWTSGDEILCNTESAANALADMLECLYKAHGEEILINTGYYDPVEDARNGETDRYAGWWYVNID